MSDEGWLDCYAVVRVDHFTKDIATLSSPVTVMGIAARTTMGDPGGYLPRLGSVTVKEIVTSIPMADSEVNRLNEINSARGGFYVWKATRCRRCDLAKLEVLGQSCSWPRVHLYAVVSVLVDSFGAGSPEAIDVEEVVLSREEAKGEVEGRSQANIASGRVSFWQTTRMRREMAASIRSAASGNG